MTDKTTIEINVDTFSDGDAYFVRTEIDARSVSIHGPFPDPQTAQKLKADQLANRERVFGGCQGTPAACHLHLAGGWIS